jgi:ankyrin repeat protein
MAGFDQQSSRARRIGSCNPSSQARRYVLTPMSGARRRAGNRWSAQFSQWCRTKVFPRTHVFASAWEDMDLIPEVVTNVPFDGGNAAVLLPRMTLPLPPGPSEQEFFMKRSASFRNDIPSANHQNLAASTAQRDTDFTDEGSAVERTDQEIDHHTASQDLDQIGSMPFPGPFAYALLPTAAGQAGQGEVPAALDMPATTYASSTATTSSASAEAPAGSAMPEAAQNGQKGNPDGLPPLLLAARLGDLDQLRMLLAQPGTDVMQAHVDGLTALYIAAREGHAAVVECLVDAGADVSHEVPQTASTALMIGSKKGRLDVVKALLRHPGIQVDQVNDIGDTALIFASWKGHAAVVECLIEAGADVNHVVDDNGATPLALASRTGQLEVVKVLLKRPDIRVNLAGPDGTPLHEASEAGHVAIVECLINKGADRTLIYSGHKSCLSVATHHGRANVVEYLLGLGGPMPNPRPRLSPDAEHFDCLSDLYLDWPRPPPRPTTRCTCATQACWITATNS